MNTNLVIKKAFKEQVKICMKTTFATNTQQHISKRIFKSDTIVLALVMFFYNRNQCKEYVQSVELCNIYNYKQLCLHLIFRF